MNSNRKLPNSNNKASKSIHPADVTEDSVEDLERDDSIIGKALAGSLIVFAFLGVLIASVVFWLRRPEEKLPEIKTELVIPKVRDLPTESVPRVTFTDITKEAGIDFRHVSGARGEKLLPETMGGGWRVFDFDHDGDQDLLLVNSSEWPWTKEPATPKATPGLYQNDGKGSFKNVTVGSGLDVTLFGMGVAIGDYDNDGWSDVFLSAVGTDRLFHNEQGKFRDVTEQAGVAGSDQEWGTSCGWFDCDNDGDLDLFVGNYVRWSREIDLSFRPTIDGVNRAYGPPFSFEGTFPYLYRNEGDGKFTDISAESGIRSRIPIRTCRRLSRWGSRSATWTTTARWTLSWRTTPFRIFCFTTRAVAGSPKSRRLPEWHSTVKEMPAERWGFMPLGFEIQDKLESRLGTSPTK